MIRVNGVSKAYGEVEALVDATLAVDAGEIVALLGANGSGKTTLLSIVAGLVRPDSGEVQVSGEDVVARRRSGRKYVAVAPQETAIYPVLTARENLLYFAELGGLRGKRARSAVEQVAADVGLSEALDRRVRQLSGGERRRVHTGLALVTARPVLLLDEPTVGADIESRRSLLELIKKYREEGRAVLYTTHYLAEVEALSPTVAVIDSGRILFVGLLQELVKKYGMSTLELVFKSRVPPAFWAERDQSENRVQIRGGDGGVLGAEVIRSMTKEEQRELKSIEIREPSLETAYLKLTGRGATGENIV